MLSVTIKIGEILIEGGDVLICCRKDQNIFFIDI